MYICGINNYNEAIQGVKQLSGHALLDCVLGRDEHTLQYECVSNFAKYALTVKVQTLKTIKTIENHSSFMY